MTRPLLDGDQRDNRALVAVAAQFFVNGAVFGSVSPRLPEIRDHVDISAGQVGLLMSIAGLGGLLGSAFAGRAIERFETRRVILFSASVVALALPLVGFAQGPLLVAVGLLLMMSFDVPVDVAMNLQGSWLSARRPVPVMNRLHGLWSLGTMVGGVVSSQMAQAGVPVRSHLLGAAVVLLILLVVISRGLLSTDEVHVTSGPVAADKFDRDSHVSAAGRRRGRGGLLLFVIAGYAAIAVEATSIDWSAFRFADDLDQTPSRAAWAFVAVTGGMTAGRFAGDWAAVRLGKARLLDAAAALTAAGLAVAALVDNPALALAGFLAAGVGIAVFLPEVYDRAARVPGRPGAGLGALTAGLRLAALSVPALVGLVIELSGSVGYAIAVTTLPAIAIFVMAVRRMPATEQGYV